MEVVPEKATETALGRESRDKGFLDFDNANNARLKTISEFYKANHENQTVQYVRESKVKILGLQKARMTMWEALMLLEDVQDDSDPDTSLSQLMHAFQTAEGCRKAFPDQEWMHVLGLIHDCGKFLCHPKGYNLPSWTSHGDSFIVGASWAPSCVYRNFFDNNPDAKDSRYNTLYGIYTPHCGFDNCHMSFGHDEYLYWVLKNNTSCLLPPEALYVVRYHSFHPFHYWGDYMHLASDYDLKHLPLLKNFGAHDLYTKRAELPEIEKLKDYYKPLVEKWCPGVYDW